MAKSVDYQPPKSTGEPQGIAKMERSSLDDGQALITPFKALNSSRHRQRALEGLVKALTHQQIRELRSLVEEVDLHCDIIAKLPLEIGQVILQYLPLYQIFQARRVSSEWRQILGSARTVEHLLRDWFPNDNVDHKLQIPPGVSAESVALVKAKHVDAYRTGHAFSYASHRWRFFPDPYVVAYADGILAWLDYTESHLIKVTDLKTGQEWSFLPEARTRVMTIAISSSIVAALGSGRCNVWTLRTGSCHCLQLPSARGVVLAVTGESLAIMHSAEWHKAGSRVELITWTLKNQRTSSFFVTLSSKKCGFQSQLRLELDNKGQSLVFLESIYDCSEDGRPIQFHYKRTSLDGGIIAQGSIDIADTRNYHGCSASALPREVNGKVVIWSFAKHQRAENDLSELMLICYDFRKDQLEVRRQVVTGLRMDLSRTSKLFVWKDTAYFVGKEDNRLDLRVIDLQESTCSKARMDFPVNTPRSDRRPQEEDMLELDLLGDETFLVAFFVEGFRVWCFDANVRMSMEDIAYKKQRKDNIERRLEMKRAGKHSSSNESRSCA